MRQVVALDEVAGDLLDARDFYDKRHFGVGDYCIRCLREDIDRLKVVHGMHEKHHGFFRLISEKFPYGIYYRDLPERTEVIAVLDLRRDPRWLHKALADRRAGVNI
ncbi:MAG: hypothetical protein QM769_04600 [Pseudoxanthomonas sp.]